MERGDSAAFFNRTCRRHCLYRAPSFEDFISFTSQCAGEFQFKRPPEAPTFYPTTEEFKDPILYISRIRPLAEQFGMCKIVPPAETCFPFALDVDNFKFATRIQHLNKIDATARNKMIFLGRLMKFWELQGSPFNSPLVERRVLDLYTLQRTVQSEGGFERVNRDKKWVKVATRMNFPAGRPADHVGPILKDHYEKIILPYILFSDLQKGKRPRKDSKTSDQKKRKKPNEPKNEIPDSESNVASQMNQNIKDEPKESQMVSSVDNEATEPPDDKSKDEAAKSSDEKSKDEAAKSDDTSMASKKLIDEFHIEPHSSERMEIKTEPQPSTSKEYYGAHGSSELQKQDVSSEDKTQKTEFKIPLTEFKIPLPMSESAFKIERQNSEPKISNEVKRLQFYGAGPKSVVDGKSEIDAGGRRKREERKSPNKKDCTKCQNSNIDEISIECNGCDGSYHLSCTVPPLSDIPRGKWHCSKCIFTEMQKSPIEAFGFEDGKKEYKMREFEQMADTFKMNYFRMPLNMPDVRLVEKEFWRIVNETDHDIKVEYGADINGLDHGTGFPTSESLMMCNQSDYEYHKSYLEHPWNLNNLPVCDGSVFKHIDEPVSGMKIPWMYVGMCFSTFCWHNEDHWSYSINFLHWGQEKTWYSVPGDYAEEFENVMKQTAPELFEAQPDILHQLVTLISPNVLMDAGIPVYRTDQEAGHFVITFPRAYHAGFNHGFNFAEAVNFAPPDWIQMGRKCIDYYSLTKRFCVFSQDELLFKIAIRHLTVDLRICAAAYQDLYRAVHDEIKNRETVLNVWGVTSQVVHPFEVMPDDERQCDYCKTTVFMSAILCKCDEKKLVCIKHYDKLCSQCTPQDHTLKIKFTIENTFSIFIGIRRKVEPYERWVKSVRDILRTSSPVFRQGLVGLEQLKVLITQAENNRYPNSQILQHLVSCIEETEECDEIVGKVLSVFRCRSDAGVAEDINHKDRPNLKEVTDLIDAFLKQNVVLVNEDEIVKYLKNVYEWKSKANAALRSNCNNSEEIEIMKNEGLHFGLDLPEIDRLGGYVDRLKWREELVKMLQNPQASPKEVLLKHIEDGFMLDNVYDPKVIEGIIKIEQLLSQIDNWEAEARKIISVVRPKPSPDDFKKLLEDSEKVNAYLPSKKILEGILETGAKWVEKVVAANALKNGPYVDVYEDLLSQSKKINLQLILSNQIEIQLDLVRMWKEKVVVTFLKNNSLTLMEALAPRNEIGIKASKKKRSENYVNKNIVYGVKLSGETDPGVVVAAFKKAEKYEFDLMTQLRLENARKKIDKDAKYCICRKPASGFMMECSLCKEKFHGSCLQMGIESNKASTELADTKFLCPVCVRTKRPKLDVLFELVQSMHMIKVRIPEGEALQRLTERAMNWQDRARKLLNTQEMFTALQRLSVPLPSIPRVNTEWQSKMTMIRTQQPGNFDRPATMTSGILSAQASTSRGVSSSSQFLPLDHVYSTVSRKSIPPKKHMRKSPLIPRVLEEPARMSESGFKQLKELMIQGDLMEVFVEETTYIWKLLQTFKQVHFSIWDEGYEDFVKHEAMKAEAAELKAKVKSVTTSMKNLSEEKPPAAKKRAAVETQATTQPKKTVKGPKKITPKKTNTIKTMKAKKIKTDDKQKLATKRVKKSTTGPGTAKRRKTTKGATQSSDKAAENDDEDENNDDSCEDDCAAEPCKRPTGSALHWVQCDGGCDLWFHLVCLGLSKNDVDANEDYVCDKCK